MEKKKKEYIGIIPEEIQDKINTLPKEERDELNQAITDICNGKVEGDPFKPEQMTTKLKCGHCGTKDMRWMKDKFSKEVYYHCNDCGESGWMYDWEYDEAIEKNPDMVIVDD